MFLRVFLFLPWMSAMAQATQQQPRCGCTDCTEAILGLSAGDETCGSKIEARVNDRGENEATACASVSQSYPLECGPFCHPDKCDGKAPPLCGCEFCSKDVWNTTANGFTCGERVLFVIGSFGEQEACRRVAEQYPDECGQCHPLACAAPRTPLPSLDVRHPDARCGCLACDDNVLSNTILGYSCRERIDFLTSEVGGKYTEFEACYHVAETFPVCGPECHPEKCGTTQAPAPSEYCSCQDCNEDVLNSIASGFTCGDRIRFLQSPEGGNYTEEESCSYVASEFRECRGCGPNICDGRSKATRNEVNLLATWSMPIITCFLLFKMM